MKRRQRTRIFCGHEGGSEQSYGAAFAAIVDEVRQEFHFDNRVTHGGDPLAIVENTVKELLARRNRHGEYRLAVVLLDRDKLGQSKERDAKIPGLLKANGIHPIWQRPCHEGFLLRHLAGAQALQPATSEIAMQALVGLWPSYEKGMPAIRLREKIDMEAVKRARAVEPDLDAFLTNLGFPKDK